MSHRNVCRVHDIGDVDGAAFISMEYVDGEDLGSLLRRIGRLPGDVRWETGRFRLYLPIVSMIIVSLVLSLLAWIFRQR